jgi:two-component system sensor kinase FixL
MSEPPTKTDPPIGSAQLEPVLDAMIESLIVIDSTGIIERVNKATQGMFGYEPDELIGRNISKLMSGSDQSRHDNYLSRYQKTGERRIIGVGREVQARHKDGSSFPAKIAVGEVSSAGETRYVGLISDLTEQRQAEAQALIRREEMVNVSRLSTMGEMAAAMAHELNQPLTAIANYAAASKRLLDKGPEYTDDVKEALQEIYDQAHRAGEVIRRTRNFTKSAEAMRGETTLAEVAKPIRSLAELDTKANNIRLRWDIQPDLPPIDVDSVQIQQVILNLIRNAVDAMHDTEPDRRIIAVKAKLTAPHQIRLEVSDQGHGVQDGKSSDIFNAFFTTKKTGMGMGLAICRTIIRAHGGELGFRNNDPGLGGHGATFFFTIPTQVNS